MNILQALTIASKFGVPQRVISGIDHKQVILIAAILEKYTHIKLSGHDIFFKISGGFKVKGNTADLGIALALLSSYFQQSLPTLSIALGEINLSGEVKPISQIDRLVKEAEKFGITTIYVSKQQSIKHPSRRLQYIHTIQELLPLFVQKL